MRAGPGVSLPNGSGALVRSGTMVCTRCVCCPCLVCDGTGLNFDVEPQISMRSDFPSASGSRVGPADTDFIFTTSFGSGQDARGSNP
jgi:hypothetical protein